MRTIILNLYEIASQTCCSWAGWNSRRRLTQGCFLDAAGILSANAPFACINLVTSWDESASINPSDTPFSFVTAKRGFLLAAFAISP